MPKNILQAIVSGSSVPDKRVGRVTQLYNIRNVNRTPGYGCVGDTGGLLPADAMLRNYTYHHASRRRIFVKKQLEDCFEGSGDLTSTTTQQAVELAMVQGAEYI